MWEKVETLQSNIKSPFDTIKSQAESDGFNFNDEYSSDFASVYSVLWHLVEDLEVDSLLYLYSKYQLLG